MRIRMKTLARSSVLAGALSGRKTLGLLLEGIDEETKAPETVYLDFAGIEVATASFLRESILEFRDIVRRRWTNYYPVVANTNDTVTEELSMLLDPQRDVLMLCTLSEYGVPGAARLVGKLEPKQRITFDLVKTLGEADAGELMRAANGSERVGQTAWNNRLASLSRLGLLMETSYGRAKRYRPLPLGG
ncbi:MAG: hypothetical protein Tsb0027_23610 [Wenzhouxiangellaceae bacterium]